MKRLLALAIALAALAPSVAAQTAAGFTGKWEGTFTRMRSDGTEASQAIAFDLTQKDEALTGTAGPPDQALKIDKGAVTAGKATFEVQLPDGSLYKFTLAILDERLQGEMTGERDGVVRGSAKVVAAKAK